MPPCLVEAGQELLLEPRRKRRARLVLESAHSLEAKPPQRRASVRLKPERLDRQGLEHFAFLTGFENNCG